MLVTTATVGTSFRNEPSPTGATGAAHWNVVSKMRTPKIRIGASLLGSIAFYVITNTGDWLLEPLYAKTFAGWVQALTTGLPESACSVSGVTNSHAAGVIVTITVAPRCFIFTMDSSLSARPAALFSRPASKAAARSAGLKFSGIRSHAF